MAWSSDTPSPPAGAAPLELRTVRFAHVAPARDLVFRLAHLQPDRPNHQRWIALTDQLLTDLAPLMRPRGVYRIDRVTELTPRRIALASGVAFDGAVGAFLEHATHVATYVVTIGSAVERLARAWLKAGKVMQGAIADAIASQAVEAAGELLADDVRTWARAHGGEITPPYSPGYCGLSVRAQIPLFASLPVAAINVRRTASCLMLPMKSISGLIGVGPADKVRAEAYPCEACTHADCTQRRAPVDRARLAAAGDFAE